MENVYYIRAYTSDEQIEIMDSVAALFHQEPGVFKLLIVDSIMALFRVDYSGRGELADRQQKLAQVTWSVSNDLNSTNSAKFSEHFSCSAESELRSEISRVKIVKL